MKSISRLGAAALSLACFLAPAIGQAGSVWPTWRGTSGAGTAPGAQPPLTWSTEKNLKWKTAIPGLGFSTPIIWENRIFLLTAIETNEEKPAEASASAAEPAAPAGDKKGGRRKGPGNFGGAGGVPSKFFEFAVIALDRGTGKILWQKTARREVPHEGRHATNSYASASPVTDGEHLYVPFGSRGFYCYDLQGNLKWEKDLGNMRTRGSFGEGASPALAGNLLLIHWDHEDGSYIVALDKKTGKEVWRKDRDEVSSWSTPLIVEVGGRQQAIVSATTRTRSYDVATGDIVWEAGGQTMNVIPMPVTGNGLVYVASGFRGNSLQAIKLSAKGDVTDSADIVWSFKKSTPYVPSPALSGERIYFIRSNDAILSCLNALTGEVHYQDKQLPGVRGGVYASPLVANGHVYIVGREGTTLALKDKADFEVISTNSLDERIDASPVALDRELFLRGHEHLYCFSES